MLKVPAQVATPVVETPAPVAPAPAAASASAGTVITMPALGESVSEGTVTRWLKNVGDSVAVDEALLEVSTDKVDTEIPSPVAGVLLAIDVPVDTTVPVGARLALIGAANGAVVSTPAPAAPPAHSDFAHRWHRFQLSQLTSGRCACSGCSPVTPPPAPVVAAPAAPLSQPADAYVTPIVRKLANDLGVNLASVKGTGIGGRIRREDVEAAAPLAAALAQLLSASANQQHKHHVQQLQ